jgi:hypothetical protein
VWLFARIQIENSIRLQPFELCALANIDLKPGVQRKLPASAAVLCPSPSACDSTRPLFHRRIFEIHDAIGGRATDEFSGKSAPDIILLNRPKPSRNETPQPSSIARRVSIACDNSRAENRQTFEADTLNGFFL